MTYLEFISDADIKQEMMQIMDCGKVKLHLRTFIGAHIKTCYAKLQPN